MKHKTSKLTRLSAIFMALALGAGMQAEGQCLVRVEKTDGTHIEKPLLTGACVTLPKENGQERILITDDMSEDYTAPLKEVKQFSVSPLTDLQGSSNSYIVTAPGTYIFFASHVDDTFIDNIDSADWLWREKSTEPLISDVSYNNGRITFKAGSGKGNAVIAARNAEGTIVWTWHIWLTDQPQDMRFSTGAYVMDRNLGAVSCREEDGRDTWGLTYQYGRPNPFYYIGDNQEYDPKEAMDQPRKHTEVNPIFGQTWGLETDKTTEAYTLEEAMARPMTHLMRKYISGTKGGYHWAADNILDEVCWGNNTITTKTNYDPCPRGYKVPFYQELDDLKKMTWDNTQIGNMDYPVKGFTVPTEDGDQWWPMVCGRHYEDGCAIYGGQAKAYSDRLFLWTAFAGAYAASLFSQYPYVPLRIIVQNNPTKSTLEMFLPTVGAGAFNQPIRCVRESVPTEKVQRYAPQEPAADVALTLADGSETRLAHLLGRSQYTLVYFNNPDCSSCREMKTRLQQSAAVQQMHTSGALQIVSIYTDEEPELWRAHLNEYPASWTVAMDAQQSILQQGLYDMRTTPSLYVLDAQGRIVLADTTLEEIEKFIL